MTHPSRRRFFRTSAQLGLAAAVPALPALASSVDATFERRDERISLDGAWQFRIDPDQAGDAGGWHRSDAAAGGWSDVTVPHTWQVTPGSTDYYGVAWYRRRFDAPAAWASCAVRIDFLAVFHTATVWVNGRAVGQHAGKGYTAFTVDISAALELGGRNLIVVRVDNGFNDSMLPRGRSSDWAHDGGIYRPVSLVITPRAFIERIAVDAAPDLGNGTASLSVTATIRNTLPRMFRGTIEYRVVDEEADEVVLAPGRQARVTVKAGATLSLRLPPATLTRLRLWHFDHPHLYRLELALTSEDSSTHLCTETFGVRSFETRDGGFYLNGERVFLMGVERMAGSHPRYGMAEPSSWIVHDQDDLKELNCVFTRVHWQQDPRVLDYCDRHGILVQLEVPTWGPDTFKETGAEPLPALMQNGLEQLREMIEQNRNHPSVVVWGLCNEIGGQRPPAYAFARRMYEEAKRLDPIRLCTYASNSLQQTPERDVAGLMDFVEWNEYYESWYGGNVEDVRRNLERIHRAFPDKAIVISEYGYCACTPERPEGDDRRIDILREHTKAYREHDYVGGLIFFCYNDYRTHIGDKGLGALKQRVHGVVDVYGRRKPSFEVLARESSPIESGTLTGPPAAMTAAIRTRAVLPAYSLAGYVLRWIVRDSTDVPIEQHETVLPRLAPGTELTVKMPIESAAPSRVQIDVVRPTGFPAWSAGWPR
jgi:beta-glucuronidase